MLVVNPETELEEIIQNVRTILSTPKGTVPLMRDFGVSWQIVDTLTPELEMKIKEEIYLQVEKWEKRAKVKSISLKEEDGKVLVELILRTFQGETPIREVIDVSSG